LRNGDIYKFDLQNRFPSGSGYIVSESIVNDVTIFVVINGIIQGRSKSANRDQAIYNVRNQLVGGSDILPELTSTQRNTLTGVIRRQMIYNITTNAIETFDGTNWV